MGRVAASHAMWAVALGIAMPTAFTLVIPATRSAAQSPPPAPGRESAAGRHRLVSSPLDVWLVTRLLGTQLLPESALPADARNDRESFTTVESTREAPGGDTLFALHFGADDGMAARQIPFTVRLSGPTGAIASHAARVVARRAFRAPRRPNANPSDDRAWRYGSAYLAVVLRGSRPPPSVGYRGWLLIASPDSTAANQSRRPGADR